MTSPIRQPKPANQPVPLKPPASEGRVLLLDDDTGLSLLLKELLEINSYEVTCVTSGVEGLREIMASDFDAILCDMMMPNLAGDMFYMAVERVKPHLCPRFVFMSGHRGEGKTEAFVKKVGGVMLWKPFEMHVMLEAIGLVARKAAQQQPSRKPPQSSRLHSGEWVVDP